MGSRFECIGLTHGFSLCHNSAKSSTKELFYYSVHGNIGTNRKKNEEEHIENGHQILVYCYDDMLYVYIFVVLCIFIILASFNFIGVFLLLYFCIFMYIIQIFCYYFMK